MDAVRLSKTLGALLGVHAGDSLGASFEFETHQNIKKHFPQGLRDIIGGGPFGWPAGHATDDTDLTRAVLLAYHDREKHKKLKGTTEGFDITQSAAEWSLKWFDEGPVDIGNATSIGLGNYRTSRDPRRCGAGHGSAGNGSLMRCIPTGLLVYSRDARIKESMEISAITHNDLRCTVSCAAYNEIVAALLEGKSSQEAVAAGFRVAQELGGGAVEKSIQLGTELSISRIASEGPGSEMPHKARGYVLDSLSLAIAALLDPRSLEDVLVDVVRIGGDTDTNGAISGGLVGVRDGVEAIPERWLGVLQFRDEFEQLAKSMLQVADSS